MLEQRLRALEGALGFVRSGAKHLYRRRSPQRGERYLEIDARVALLGQREQRHCTFCEAHRLRGAEMQQRGLCGLGVVAQRGHGLVAELEMGRELGRAHIASPARSRSSAAATAMQPDTSERADALVKHFPVERVPKNIFRVEIAQPTLPARELGAGFRQRCNVLSSTRATVASRNSTPHTLAASSRASWSRVS